MTAVAELKVQSASRLFRALGDETRLRMVALLTHGELCVCHLEAALSMAQPTVSRHLAVLRNAGVVEARREGSWVYYRLAAQADEISQAAFRALKGTFGKRELLAKAFARLVKARGPNSCR